MWMILLLIKDIYGTIMIDIDSDRIINILDSHDKDKVTEWLKIYPNIKVVSRDDHNSYGAAKIPLEFQGLLSKIVRCQNFLFRRSLNKTNNFENFKE